MADIVSSTQDPGHISKADYVITLYLGEEIIFSLYKLRKNIHSGLLLGMIFGLQVELCFFFMCVCVY